MPPAEPIDLDRVRSILDIEDPVRRNLWITLAYHDFARRLDPLVGEVDATWCAFGTWASKTAGRTIRGEDVERVLHDALTHVALPRVDPTPMVNRRLRWLQRLHLADSLRHLRVLQVLVDVLDEVSGRIAQGNTLVFEELGPAFAVFLEQLEEGSDGAPDPDWATVEAALDALERPPAEPVKRALRNWHAVTSEPNRRIRAQLVLHANVEAVHHEQERLQQPIEAALTVPIDESIGRLLDGIVAELARFVPRSLLRRFLARELDELRERLERVAAEAATELILVLVTGDEQLHLGDDVPELAGALFPNDLASCDLPELVELLQRLDRTGGTGRPTGAANWAELGDRMNYIVTLFRSRQQHRPLLDPPFTEQQVAALVAGSVPPPPL